MDLTDNLIEVDDIILIETKPGKDKRARKSFDDYELAQKLHMAMTRCCQGRQIAFSEMPIGSQSARAMASYGISVGLMASLPIPLIQVSPAEVKLASFGDKDAAKEEMITWATKGYPHLKWTPGKSKGRFPWALKNEHMADAIGAMHAGVGSDDFRRVTAMLKAVA